MRDNYQNDEFLRKRKERQRKIRKRRAKIVLVFLMVILLITAAILSVTALFPIKNITATGSKIYSQNQIIEASGIKTGDNLIVASQDSALASLKSKLPFVEQVEFERSFPDTLKIKITDAKEFACYKTDDKYFAVSKSGWVLKQYTKKPKDLMLIISDNVKCKVGSEVSFSDSTVSELCENVSTYLHKYELSADYVDVQDKLNIKAKIDGRFIVNFGSSKDFESKVKHLVAMMEEIGENVTGKIDLSMWSSQNTQGAFVKTAIK